jgi:hypothetical protein
LNATIFFARGQETGANEEDLENAIDISKGNINPEDFEESD